MSAHADRALNLYHRYVVELVEALNLCPWAAEARRRGEVRVKVFEGDTFDRDAVERFIDAVAADETLVIGIGIFVGLVRIPRSEWLSTVAALQRSEVARFRGAQAPMSMAAFHPDAPADISTAGRLTAFIRRSPDPVLQLVRQRTLERVRDDRARRTAFYDPRSMDMKAFLKSRKTDRFGDRIVDANHKSIERYGLEKAAALLDELRALRLE